MVRPSKKKARETRRTEILHSDPAPAAEEIVADAVHDGQDVEMADAAAVLDVANSSEEDVLLNRGQQRRKNAAIAKKKMQQIRRDKKKIEDAEKKRKIEEEKSLRDAARIEEERAAVVGKQAGTSERRKSIVAGEVSSSEPAAGVGMPKVVASQFLFTDSNFNSEKTNQKRDGRGRPKKVLDNVSTNVKAGNPDAQVVPVFFYYLTMFSFF